MNAQGTRQAQNMLRNMRIHTQNFVCIRFIRLFTVPKSTHRPHQWAASVHFTAKDRHKATELGLTWHASFIGTSIEIYLAPGWSGQGV